MRQGLISDLSTTTKAIITALILATVIGSVIGFVSYYNYSNTLKDNIIKSLVRRADENADLVCRILEVFETNIEGIAYRSEIQSMDWSIQKPVLINEGKRLNVLRFQVADLTGKVNSTSGKTFDISERAHFKDALNGLTTVSDPLISKDDGNMVIICATPISDSNGIIKGVLTAALDSQFLFNIIKNRKIEKTGYGFMLNNKGIIIAHPKGEILLTEAAAVWDKDRLKGFEQLAELELKMMEGKKGFGSYIYHGQKKCMAFAPVPGTTWSLGLAVPRSEVFYELDTLHNQFIIVSTIAILISIALIVIVLTYTAERRKSLVLEKDIEISHRLLKETEELDKLRTQFFANISHELRTPLNVISSTIQLCELYIRTKYEPKNLEKHIKVLKQNSQRLMRLINNIIDTTRIDARFYEIEQCNHDLIGVLEDIVLSTVDYAKMKNINLVFDTNVEELITAFDADKLERVMLNLLSNAIKFTESGGSILVSISREKDLAVISVKDSGIGIPESKLNLIFERFIRVDGSMTRSHEGSGIGLSLVKSIIEMHKGSISVRSEEGKGSEFIIKLPLMILTEEKGIDKRSKLAQSYKTGEKTKEEFSDINMI